MTKLSSIDKQIDKVTKEFNAVYDKMIRMYKVYHRVLKKVDSVQSRLNKLISLRGEITGERTVVKRSCR